MIRPLAAAELASSIREALARQNVPGRQLHVVDLRAAETFLAGHVPGARHVPASHVLRWVPQRCHTQDTVVLIDEDGRGGGAAREAAHALAHRWFRNLRYLAGGFAAWQSQALPVQQGGATGPGAGSHDGTKPEFQRSAAVPWETPQDVTSRL